VGCQLQDRGIHPISSINSLSALHHATNQPATAATNPLEGQKLHELGRLNPLTPQQLAHSHAVRARASFRLYRERKVLKIIANNTKSLFFKTAISIL